MEKAAFIGYTIYASRPHSRRPKSWEEWLRNFRLDKRRRRRHNTDGHDREYWIAQAYAIDNEVRAAFGS